MSKKHRLLGPDGKPLDVAKYRPKPEPVATVRDVTATFTMDFHSLFTPRVWGFGIDRAAPAPRAERPLRDAVSRDLEAIHATLPAEWQGKAEIEPVPPERSDTYDAAFGSAVRKCNHSRSSTSTTYARGERQCDDCGRYFTRRGMFE